MKEKLLELEKKETTFIPKIDNLSRIINQMSTIQ